MPELQIKIDSLWWTPVSASLVCLMCGNLEEVGIDVPDTALGFIQMKMRDDLPDDCKHCQTSQALCG